MAEKRNEEGEGLGVPPVIGLRRNSQPPIAWLAG